MPSPFPGMDPWLEHPDIFPDIHDRLIIHASEAIQAVLPPPYYAVIGRRVWVELSHRPIGPDVEVRRSARSAAGQPTSARGGAAVAEADGRMLVITIPHDERREVFVQVFTGRGQDRRLVTCLEVLSPTNKAPGQHGRDLYVRKQQEILESQVNLVEIDLLRAGAHTTCVPADVIAPLAPPFDYHACVHRFDRIEDYFVYPVRLEESLPRIAVPLMPGDEPVLLDLQALFDRCYDAGPYSHEIDYTTETPVPPLAPDQAAWAQARVVDWLSHGSNGSN